MTAMGSKRGTYASLNEAPTTQAAATINAIKDYILQTHLKPGDRDILRFDFSHYEGMKKEELL